MRNGLFDLTGRVALVTGGNGGIGFGMARGLALHGATVVVWGTSAEKNARAVQALAELGATVRSAQVDVADHGAVRAGIGAIVEEFGRIDQAIASAGVNVIRQDMFDIAEEDFQRTFAVNVLGAFFTLREAARSMIERGRAGDRGGSLVAVGSIGAIQGAACNEHYGASKGAVVSLARAMAVELAPEGIRVNAVLPGFTRSDMTEPLQDRYDAYVVGRAPVRRWGEGEDFAAIAVYLASAASSFHVGDAIVIDGGYTIA